MSATIRVFHFGSYLVFLLSERLIRLLPLDCAFLLGQAGGELAYRLFWRRRELALRNIRFALGQEMSENEMRKLNRKHFQLVGANLLAGLKIATLPPVRIWDRVTVVNSPTERPSGWIALISHTGNWELYSHLIDFLPEYRFGAVYQPLRNQLVDRHVRAARARSGITLFDRRTQLLSCIRFLREGGNAVGVLADQGAGYAGLWTPLFGRLASSSTLPAILSIRSGHGILPIAISTSGRARWKISTLRPIFPQTDSVEALTVEINRALEEKVRLSPADWLWAHNRWKPLRPHFLFARERRRVVIPPDIDPATLHPFRILIVSPASAEHAKASFDAVRAIRNGRPDTHITVLAPDSLGQLWTGQGIADTVISWGSNESSFSIARRLRGTGQFDCSVSFSARWKTAFAVWLAGVPLRVGERGGANTLFCNQHPHLGHMADPQQFYREIAWSVGAEVNAAAVV